LLITSVDVKRNRTNDMPLLSTADRTVLIQSTKNNLFCLNEKTNYSSMLPEKTQNLTKPRPSVAINGRRKRTAENRWHCSLSGLHVRWWWLAMKG